MVKLLQQVDLKSYCLLVIGFKSIHCDHFDSNRLTSLRIYRSIYPSKRSSSHNILKFVFTNRLRLFCRQTWRCLSLNPRICGRSLILLIISCLTLLNASCTIGFCLLCLQLLIVCLNQSRRLLLLYICMAHFLSGLWQLTVCVSWILLVFIRFCLFNTSISKIFFGSDYVSQFVSWNLDRSILFLYIPYLLTFYIVLYTLLLDESLWYRRYYLGLALSWGVGLLFQDLNWFEAKKQSEYLDLKQILTLEVSADWFAGYRLKLSLWFPICAFG